MKKDWKKRLETRNGSEDDARSEYDIDYSRIIHSFSFRRLQGKTQILNLGDGDFYRTRLTHSLEVAQISAALANQMRRNDPSMEGVIGERSLMEAIGLVHDIGHPPFGHGGEYALNYCMRNHGGFEGNAQTIRLLTKVEKLTRPRREKITRPKGLNLTRRCLLAVLKYPARYSNVVNRNLAPDLLPSPSSISVIDRKKSKPPKCYFDCDQDVIDFLLKPLSDQDRKNFQCVVRNSGKHNETIHKSLDCSAMNIADDIAYGVHDLEDAVALKLMEKDQFEEVVEEAVCEGFIHYIKKRGCGEASYKRFISALFGGDAGERKHWIGRLVGYFVTNIKAKKVEDFEERLLQYKAELPKEASEMLEALKKVVREKVILGARVQHLEFKGQQMVVAVFEAMESNPDTLLPDYVHSRFNAEAGDKRVICDYISGMTDTHLLKTYERLFSPRMGSVFDML